MKWLATATQVLAAIINFFVARKERNVGRLEERNEQLEQDLSDIHRSDRAADRVEHDADSVRNDPSNRDREEPAPEQGDGGGAVHVPASDVLGEAGQQGDDPSDPRV